MQILSAGNFNNIGRKEEYIDIKTSTGQTARLIINQETNDIRLILDHNLLANCKQTKDFQPILEVEGFYNG